MRPGAARATGPRDRMHDLALPLPTQRPDEIERYCGEVVTNRTLDVHILASHRRLSLPAFPEQISEKLG